jgi:hypothetical protein
MPGILGDVGVVIGECDVDNRLYRNADKCPCLLVTEDASNSNSASSGEKAEIHLKYRNLQFVQAENITYTSLEHLRVSGSSIVLKEQHPEM